MSEDKRFCRICQHCQHVTTGPPVDKNVAEVEELLVQVASGVKLVNDRPNKDSKDPTDLTAFPFLSRTFGTLAKLSATPGSADLTTRLNNHTIRCLYEAIPTQLRPIWGSASAGTTYARTCQGRYRHQSLPNPNDIYEKLFKASPEKREPHPRGSSSLTFAFASLVTHSLFRTDPRDWNKNNTSSYLDLSPLYGSNQEEQNAVRIKNGLGRLHPDTFSEGRIVFLPPAAAALLVMWNRNHNYIASEILRRNEEGKWENPPPEDVGHRLEQDEEIFQTARLINCGSFMSVVMNDYVAGFLGLARMGSSWNMDPFNEFRDTNHVPVGRGQGNHVSVEFNLLYRWHTVVSDEEEKWTLNILKGLFPDKKPGDLTLPDFYGALGRLRNGNVPPELIVHPEPHKRNFGGIVRGSDGRFKDSDLAKILHDATANTANRYGARGTPDALKGGYGLERFKSFEEWNSKPEIANAAKELYGTIDNLELYAGLHAEESMSPHHSGLCSGYTVTRAILSDAIALVRGDRFFTTDFTPSNLTQWVGQIFNVTRKICHSEHTFLHVLLRRTFPEHYPENSIFTLFPMSTPSTTIANLENLKKMGRLPPNADYNYDRPTNVIPHEDGPEY
ncbi:heme peroxidase [Rhizoctonia solani]|uniref:Heme peroxidase n=1 Tax=Rhizoctonia solani TaxID=456999 RepID=A0A8H7I3U7_9AGAM|nr:heme peroxidase [Rhizoctonia solani]